MRLLRTAPAPHWYTTRDEASPLGLELTYLGTAGFLLRAACGHVIALDPFVTRPKLRTLLLGKRLLPDEALIGKTIAQAHDVFVGHAHYDHVLDAPSLCRQTGARLVGSRAVCMVGRACGLPEEQLLETSGRSDIASGPFTVRGVPSRHGKVFAGRVIFPGDIEQPPPWPPRASDLKHGLVLNWHVQLEGFSLLHVDSADFVNEELSGMQADLVCLCAAGYRARPNYVRDAAQRLKPKWIMPCHWDTMTTPLHAPPRLLPGLRLGQMLREIREAGCEPLLTPFLTRQRF